MCDFSEYKTIRELGRGNQAIVYLVEKDGVKYAKKTFDLSNPKNDLGFSRGKFKWFFVTLFDQHSF
jgi:hypothetical protein